MTQFGEQDRNGQAQAPTLARVITVFNDCGYELKEASAVDMFPRTAHVEAVCLLSKKDKSKFARLLNTNLQGCEK